MFLGKYLLCTLTIAATCSPGVARAFGPVPTPIPLSNSSDMIPLMSPNPETAKQDNACAMLAAYAEMGAGDAQLKPYYSDCNANRDPDVCIATRYIVQQAKKPTDELKCEKPNRGAGRA